MATIGTFTSTDNGFTGSVKTLSLNVKTVKFVPDREATTTRLPTIRIFAGATEFGAAWKKTARETQREYLSVKLDDPSFPAPIYASLVEAEGDESYNADLVPPQRRLRPTGSRSPASSEAGLLLCSWPRRRSGRRRQVRMSTFGFTCSHR